MEPANQPLVSIGLPVKNGAKRIEEALNSLINQSYKNIEIIVCDNASKDRTAKIAERLSAQDERITVVRYDEPVDIHRSFYRALWSRTGDYFLFAPADDYWHPDFIKHAVAEMEARPDLSVVSGQVAFQNGNSERRRVLKFEEISGAPRERVVETLVRGRSQLRIYGLMRNRDLDDLFPEKGPEAWDIIPVCKLAIRGNLGFIDQPSLTRRRTRRRRYQKNIFAQEEGTLGRMFYFRRVANLIKQDPEFRPLGLRVRLALWYRTLHYAKGMGTADDAARTKSVVGLAFRIVENLLGDIAMQERERIRLWRQR